MSSCPTRVPVSSRSPTATKFGTPSRWPRARCTKRRPSPWLSSGAVDSRRMHRDRRRDKAPATSHEVQWGKIETWLQSAGKPNEQAMRGRLRELLGANRESHSGDRGGRGVRQQAAPAKLRFSSSHARTVLAREHKSVCRFTKPLRRPCVVLVWVQAFSKHVGEISRKGGCFNGVAQKPHRFNFRVGDDSTRTARRHFHAEGVSRQSGRLALNSW